MMLFYGVVRDCLDEAVELFPARLEAEAVVKAWDSDEPDRVGELHVELIELAAGRMN